MSSKSSSNVSSLKRKVQVVQTPPPSSSTTTSAKQIKKEPTVERLKSQRQLETSEDDIIRARLLYEGDQGSDDRRILTLMKAFNKCVYEIPPNLDDQHSSVDKLLSALHSIDHAHRVLNSTCQMDEREQQCYASKSKRMNDQIKQLRLELDQSELRLNEAKQKRLNLLEYDSRAATINKLGTRRELRAQQAATLERKHYFEHLQQTFEATYQQRLKQIAVYMRPIFELDEILHQDAHEDIPVEGAGEVPAEQPIPAAKFERQRTNSESSTASMDEGEANGGTRSKKLHRSSLGLNSPANSLGASQPQAFFSNEAELFGTALVNPLVLLTSSNIS